MRTGYRCPHKVSPPEIALTMRHQFTMAASLSKGGSSLYPTAGYMRYHHEYLCQGTDLYELLLGQ